MKAQTITTEQYLPATWKGGYFPVPHALRELLRRNRINGVIQMQILLEIAGEQARCGENGKPAKWASGLTVSKLAAACGRKPQRLPDGTIDQAIRGVEKALADLVARGMVQREKDGRSWRYSISPNDWRDAPRYVAEVPTDSTDEPGDPEETADEKPETIRKSTGTFVVLPGKQSRPFTLASAIQKVSFQSELSAAFECDLAVLDDGNLNVRIYESGQKIDSMESRVYAGKTRPLGRQSEAPSKAEEKAKAESPKIGDNDPLYEYAAKMLSPLTGDMPSEIVLSVTRSHLGNAPIEYLADRVRAKGAKYNSHRLLPHLAKDASERYEAERKLKRTPQISVSPDAWENRGSWAGDRHHWQELDEGQRGFYRRMYPADTRVLDREAKL